MAPVATIRVRVDREEQVLTFEASVTLYHQLAGDADKAEAALVRREVKVGAYLMQVKASLPFGRWESWLGMAGLNRKTAGKRVRLAASLASAHGELDDGKVTELVHEWNKHHGEDSALAIDAAKLNLHQAELLTGIRTPPRNLGPGRGQMNDIAGTVISRASLVAVGVGADEPTMEELLSLVGDEEEVDDDAEAGGLALYTRHSETPDPTPNGHAVTPTARASRRGVVEAAPVQLSLVSVYAIADQARARAGRIITAGGERADRAIALTREYAAAMAELEGEC